jgi:uncharacterized membrane protein YfcA
MAHAFGGRLSVGATLPMLIIADCFAVSFYRAHADWSVLRKLAPYVVVGLVAGTFFLKYLGERSEARDLLNPVIGAMVLAMLGLSLVKGKLGEKLTPTSEVGVVATGTLAGFTTMASNAAGPIMQIYLAAAKLKKIDIMGTTAWYFFIINIVKVPFLVWVSLDNPAKPLLTSDTLKFNLSMAPLILIGALSGRKLLPVIPQKVFTTSILVLAFLGGLKLLVS